MCRLKIIICFLLLGFSANAQWYPLNSGTNHKLTSVYFLNENLGWVCGDSGIVLKTTNGGDSWSQIITSSIINLRAIVFLDSLNGIVAGSNCSVYKTSNGGESWLLKNLNPNINLNDVKFINVIKALIVGDEGKMLISSDQGNTWEDISDPYHLDLNNISFLNENYGWVANNGGFKITTNGGNSWTDLYSNYEGNRVFIFNDNLIFAMGWIWGGPIGNEPHLAIRKSTNLGTSWTTLYSTIGLFKSIYFCTQLTGYVITDSGFLLYTTDGGTQWLTNYFPEDHRMNACAFIDSCRGWAVGENGLIYKTTNGGGIFTDIKRENKNSVSGFLLSQNYPNPFNPNTSIDYKIPVLTKVTLKIYDLLGNEVERLVDEEKNAGSYSVKFNGKNLSSGIYFYELKANDFVQRKKLLLVK